MKPVIKAALHIVEEASEVIKEYAKAERFGWNSWHPRDESETPNYQRFIDEIDDLERAISVFREKLCEECQEG